ncbi:MAG: hypothetical protein P4L87_15650 [Formivibrio sp.]|nr:hypothetical protein [Formivibrio sp.]
MKLIKTLTVLTAVGCCSAALTSQANLMVNFSSTEGSQIVFTGNGTVANGGAFQFNSPGANSFQIQSESGNQSTGSLVPGNVGFYGGLSSDPFSYGAITTDGSGNQSAVVSTTPQGTFYISDGSVNLTGNVNWITISSQGLNGNPGSLNNILTINISNVSYSGGNVDLQTLANLAALNFDTMSVSFTVENGQTLTDLTTSSSSHSFSYSGALSVPEPTTILAGTMLLLPFGASTLRILRRKDTV